MNYIFVFIGGGLGSALRFALSQGIPNSKLNLPLGTLLANVIACIVFAFVIGLGQSKFYMNEGLKFMLLAGFCGGLSTFSAFSNETFLMLKQGLHLYAIGNVVLNLLLCLGIFYCFNK
jgi:CrcB protein